MADRIRGRARAQRNARILKANPVCWICGQPIDLSLKWPDLRCGVVDHVKAWTHSRDDTASNLRPAHHDCNRDKSDKDFGRVIKRSGSLGRPHSA